MKGTIVIMSGPSAVGKDTLLEAWMKRNPKIKKVITWTTRKPRPNEVNGIDYYFVSEREFQDNVENNGFLEHKTVHGERYGTPLKTMRDIIESGAIAVLKIDVQGALDVMHKIPSAVSIFIMPPSFDALKERIESRGVDSPEQITLRMERAKKELEYANHYQYHVVNDTIPQAVDELEAIIQKEHCP
jgi:guanylate kinase